MVEVTDMMKVSITFLVEKIKSIASVEFADVEEFFLYSDGSISSIEDGSVAFAGYGICIGAADGVVYLLPGDTTIAIRYLPLFPRRPPLL